MKTFNYIILMVLPFIIPAVASQAQPKKLDNVFYCFNNGVRTLPNAPKGYEAQAALIKEIGFDGLAGHKEETYYELRTAMDKVSLPMPEMYIGMTLNNDGKASYHKELKNILRDSKDRNLLVALHLHNGVIDNRKKADAAFVEGIRELADFCKPLNIRIAVYPHVNFYCETVAHSVQLAQMANRRNVGAIFNLCHFLKVEGPEDWKDAIDLALPYLFMVSINGADGGDTKNMGWDRLILPLGEGSFDVYALVKYLKDHGYDGLFGLQCYNIKQDCEATLRKSMDTWNSYQQRYQEESSNDTK